MSPRRIPTLEAVRAALEWLDEDIYLLEGLRLDGSMAESESDALTHLQTVRSLLVRPSMAVPILKPGDSLGWDEDGASLEEVQQLVFRYYLDSSVTGVVIAGIAVTGAPPTFQCSFVVPPVPPGQHRVEITAANAIGESPRSVPFDFAVGAVPATPRNVHIV